MQSRQFERMISGELYAPASLELKEIRQRGNRLMEEYNQTASQEKNKRVEILKQWLGKADDTTYIKPPFFVDYGCNIYIGKHFFANYNCCMLDVANIIIGDNVMFGPNVGIYTPSHPIDAVVRNSGVELAKEIRIGNNVWLGGHVCVTPGVTIGDNTIVGAGSVVTKNLPANVIAAGNPAKVLRMITDEDQQYWQRQKEEYDAEFEI